MAFGKMQHADVMRSMELFAREVMPSFGKASPLRFALPHRVYLLFPLPEGEGSRDGS